MPAPKKPLIKIKSSDPILSEEVHNQIFKDIIKNLSQANLNLRGLAVLAYDKIAEQPFPLFNKADFLKLYIRLLQHYKSLEASGEFKGEVANTAKELAQFVCQIVNVAELVEIQSLVEDEYTKSLPDFRSLWQVQNVFSQNYNQLSTEQLLHEEETNKYARQALYERFNRISSIMASDYLLQTRIAENFVKTIEELKTFAKEKFSIKTVDKILLTLGTLKKILAWFANSGFQLRGETLLTKVNSQLSLVEAQLDSAKKSKTKMPDSILGNVVHDLEQFNNFYTSDYQLSNYAISKLAAENNSYNAELEFRSNLPPQLFPVNLRAKCWGHDQKLQAQVKAQSSATKNLNLKIVEIPNNPNANPNKITYASVGITGTELNLAGLISFTVGYYKEKWIRTNKEKTDAKIEKQRTENLIQLYDSDFLTRDFLLLCDHLSTAQLSKELVEIIGKIKITANEFIKLKDQMNALQYQMMTDPSLIPQLQPQIEKIAVDVYMKGMQFKQELQTLNPKFISEFITTVFELDYTKFTPKVFEATEISPSDSTKIELKLEIPTNPICDNTALGFLLLLDYTAKKKELWCSPSAPTLDGNGYISILLEQPVLDLMTGFKSAIPNTKNATAGSKANENLKKILRQQTQKCTDKILNLYLGFFQYDPITEKAALEELHAKLSVLTKEQETHVRKANEIAEKFRNQFLTTYLNFLNNQSSIKDEKETISVLQKLFCYVIATNDKITYKRIKTSIDTHKLWRKILSTPSNVDNNLIHWAVLYNRRGILKTLFSHMDPALQGQYANQMFTDEEGGQFSLLAIAAIENNTKTIPLLLEKGANLSFAENGKDKKTALELAAQHGKVTAMDMLLRAYFKQLKKSNNQKELKEAFGSVITRAKSLCTDDIRATKKLDSALKELGKREEKKEEKKEEIKSTTTKPVPKQTPVNPKGPNVLKMAQKYNSGIMVDCNIVLTEVAAGTRKITDLDGILTPENYSKLATFVLSQINARQTSSAVPKYRDEDLKPILDKILNFLKRDVVRYTKLLSAIADATFTSGRCKKFADSLDIRQEVKNTEEKDSKTESDTQEKDSKTESDSFNDSDSEQSDSSSTYSN